MSRVVESIVLAVGNEYAVGTYRSASLQIDNVVSTSGAVVRFEGTVDENRWYPVQVRKRGQNEWSREISIFNGDIIELQIENLTKVRVAAISETPVNAEVTWLITAPSGPVYKWVEITPADDEDFPDGVCRCLYIGVAGDLVADDAEGNTITFVNCPVGILPGMFRRVREFTTASSIVAGY